MITSEFIDTLVFLNLAAGSKPGFGIPNNNTLRPCVKLIWGLCLWWSGAGHVLHRCRTHPQPGGGGSFHHLRQPTQQTLSDGLLQSRPRTGTRTHTHKSKKCYSCSSVCLLSSLSNPPSSRFSVCQMLKYFAAFEIFFEENLPRLFSHFQTNNLTPDLYLIDWWDVYYPLSTGRKNPCWPTKIRLLCAMGMLTLAVYTLVNWFCSRHEFFSPHLSLAHFSF